MDELASRCGSAATGLGYSLSRPAILDSSSASFIAPDGLHCLDRTCAKSSKKLSENLMKLLFSTLVSPESEIHVQLPRLATRFPGAHVQHSKNTPHRPRLKLPRIVLLFPSSIPAQTAVTVRIQMLAATETQSTINYKSGAPPSFLSSYLPPSATPYSPTATDYRPCAMLSRGREKLSENTSLCARMILLQLNTGGGGGGMKRIDSMDPEITVQNLLHSPTW